ncbi:hypothetical protein KL928_003918 [Ogataea angusta]|uniref:Dihydrofolate synthetase n=1 Tax=Pichia angusta TaxID=870730 RepID=A0AAN6I4C5_PICAN|nr:uncharacterized protein KL928_003918 [Ogataea angusta]KAG7817183.1 hypothetical protein KL928_003918 [Ogataea angusta]
MGIDLQLARVKTLLSKLDFSPKFKAIHIAGTNGKGSVSSYVSHALTAQGIRNGRLNSPHLLYKWDSVQINDRAVSEGDFAAAEGHVREIDRQDNINCTEFELLTCTALKMFNERGVRVAVLETGLGGRLDATNVLSAAGTLCTAITKIGLDHEHLLGSTLEKIAYEKAGIIKEGVPCVVDGSNESSVLRTIEEIARKKGSEYLPVSDSPTQKFDRLGACLGDFRTNLPGEYQQMNLSVALGILNVLSRTFPVRKDAIERGIRNTRWPGRLQKLDLMLRSGTVPVLLDGAHNSQAAEQLSKYLGTSRSTGITFIIAMTSGKDASGLLQSLIKPQDAVIFTRFTEPVDGMPWIESYSPEELSTKSRLNVKSTIEPNLEAALSTAQHIQKPIVICGSLYLVAEVLRLHLRNGGVQTW